MTTDRGHAVTATEAKLIEVALPLDAINAASAREKSIRHGHPSTLHLWWARRPLAACRAVLFAQLVDDPSSHPERFPTEEAPAAPSGSGCFEIIERLVKWENTNNETVLERRAGEILRSHRRQPAARSSTRSPAAASIPLEAQRLGLEAHASDLNPVAVLINKALIEIPPKFAGRPPVIPTRSAGTARAGAWPRATGLAADVRCLRRVDARRSVQPDRSPVSEGTAIGWRRGDGNRLALGANGHLPEPGLCGRNAAGAVVRSLDQDRQSSLG